MSPPLSILCRSAANLLLSNCKVNIIMSGKKFFKHVCEILFKSKRNIHGDVHEARNQASVSETSLSDKTFNLE